MSQSDSTRLPPPDLPTSTHQQEAGLIVDYGGTDGPDLGGVGLLLTARQLAAEEDRTVWVRALPERSWKTLRALGLARLFHVFPEETELSH